MTNKISLFTALLFAVQTSFSQTVKVLDKTTLQPIPGVAIITNGKIGTSTNIKGEADVSAFKDADSITFRFLGYQTRVLSFNQVAQKKFRILLSEKAYALGELVVSASRFEEKKEDVAQQIQVMQSRELKFMNQQNTADMMQQSGNVMVQKSQSGGGSPIIRGFEANKILLVVDGVRMNNAIYRGGHLQNVLTIDQSMLDKTEIVFGPGSVVYGSDALGGVLHFYTKNPLLSEDTGKIRVHTNAYTRYATANNEKTGHLDFNIGSKKVGFLTGFTFSDFGDLASGKRPDDVYDKYFLRKYYADRINEKDSMMVNSKTNLQKPSGYSQYDFFEKILYRQSEAVSHVFNLQHSNSSNIPRYDRLTEFSESKLKFAEWHYGPQKRVFGSYSLLIKESYKAFDNARFVATIQKIEESRHDRRFNKSIRNNRTEQVDVATFNADFDKKISKHEIRYGSEITHNAVNSTAFSENIVSGETLKLDTRYPDGGSTLRTMAAYLTHTFEVSPKFIINNGIRYSYITLNAEFIDTSFYPFPFSEVRQKNSALNGNVGLIFMPGNQWRFSVLGSTGFRAPNVDDLSKVFESIPGKVIVPNPGLKPEKTYNAEVSIGKSIKEAIRIEATSYYTLYKNAISTAKGQFSGKDSIVYGGVISEVTSPVNNTEAFLYGTSCQAIADITGTFSISGSINYTYGRIKTDTMLMPLDHIPPVFGKTSFNLRLNRFRGEFFIMYNGWKKREDYNPFGEDNLAYATLDGMPSWNTLNARSSFQLTKNFQLQLACENILDYHYRVFASGISGAGRNFMATLRVNY